MAAGGYRDSLIAGEEPELCLRLIRAGGEVWRIPAEMTLHDAAIHRFGQWWRRTRRAGHAFAEGAHLHGAGPERHWVAETRRALALGRGAAAGRGGAPRWLQPGAGLLRWPPLPRADRPAGLALAGRRARGLPAAVFTVLGKLAEGAGRAGLSPEPAARPARRA
jgi:hypothetical protein